MIIEDLKKVLKRNFKNQGRNITLGMTVAFLLGSLGTYGADKEILIGWDGNKITLSEALDGVTSSEKDLIFDKDFIINKQITIDESAFETGIKIVNNGIISRFDKTINNGILEYGGRYYANSGNGIIFIFKPNESKEKNFSSTIENSNGIINGKFNGAIAEPNVHANLGNGIGATFEFNSRNDTVKINKFNLINKNGLISGSADISCTDINTDTIYYSNLGNGIGKLYLNSISLYLGEIINQGGIISGNIDKVFFLMLVVI